jgi:hypothetical protein
MQLFPFADIDNDYFAVGLAFLVALYGLSMGRIGIPSYIRNLFSNTIFRIVFLSLLLIHNFHRTPHVAFAVAIIFVLTLDYLSRTEARENFMHVHSTRH